MCSSKETSDDLVSGTNVAVAFLHREHRMRCIRCVFRLLHIVEREDFVMTIRTLSIGQYEDRLYSVLYRR